MDSSNMLDLHQQLFLLHASTHLEYWNQDPSLLNGIELLQSSRDHEQHLIDPSHHHHHHHHHDMVQDLGLQWSSHNNHQLAKIKEELSVESFLKLEQCEQISSAVKHEEQTQLHDELNSYNQLPSAPPSSTTVHGNLGLDPLSFGMLLPTLNIQSSTYNNFPCMETSLSSMDIEASTRFGRINAPCQSSNMNASTFFDNMSYGLSNQLYGIAQGGFINLQEIPPSVNEGKRVNCSSLDLLKPSKKPRFDSRPSLPPFKVRKEKLGDRIAALQQLVAPFGKTDTASVLMEAIGYIKFLQDQVETLSVPYMRPSNNRKLRATEEVSTTNERDDSKPDLRSRGLCLVPLSCTSYVTNDNAVWSPPNFR